MAVLVLARQRKDTFSMLPEKKDGLFVTFLQMLNGDKTKVYCCHFQINLKKQWFMWQLF